MKLKKTKKSVKQRGNTTYGHGARKKWKKSGHKGGVGMAGSGKRGDQKKTMIIKKYGNKYFGRQGVTSRKSAKRVNKVINIGDIERKFPGKSEIDLSEFKLLGSGEIDREVKLRVREASSGAVEKIEKAGGSVEILKLKKDNIKQKEEKNIINTKQDKASEDKTTSLTKSHDKNTKSNLKKDKTSGLVGSDDEQINKESQSSESNPNSSNLDINKNNKDKKEEK